MTLQRHRNLEEAGIVASRDISGAPIGDQWLCDFALLQVRPTARPPVSVCVCKCARRSVVLEPHALSVEYTREYDLVDLSRKISCRTLVLPLTASCRCEIVRRRMQDDCSALCAAVLPRARCTSVLPAPLVWPSDCVCVWSVHVCCIVCMKRVACLSSISILTQSRFTAFLYSVFCVSTFIFQLGYIFGWLKGWSRPIRKRHS